MNRTIYRNLIRIITFTLVLQYTVLCQVNFYAKRDFKAGETPFFPASADLNGDNYDDIVVVNAGERSNSVSVFLNIMLDSEPAFTSKTDFPVGDNPVYVAIADINMDGKKDIISANGNTNNVSVLINETDNNTLIPSFSSKYDFSTGNRPVSVVVADINDDSKPDLVTSNYYGESASVLLNITETGNSTPEFSQKTDLMIGTGPTEITAPDLNKDGKPDIAVVNMNTNTISIFINSTSSGAVSPEFIEKAVFNTGNNPVSIFSSDINGDGKQDLVTANFTGKSISVLINTTDNYSNKPTFADKKDFTTSGNGHAVSGGDLNKDGKPDLAVANFYLNSVSVLLNKTADSDAAPSFSSEVSFASGRTPNTVIVAYFNEEPYLVTANIGDNSISVLTHNSLNLDNYLVPFWSADTVYNETILPLSSNSGIPEGKLLYNAKEIISVNDACILKEYIQGKDWIYNNGKIFIPEGSSAPYMNDYDLLFNRVKRDSSISGKAPGTYVLYMEGFFHSKQLAVTYIPDEREEMPALIPAYADKLLANTINKLKNKQPLKIVYFGDSITKGANSSGFIGISPYMPIWTDLVTYNLQKNYNTTVEGVNHALGGAMSQWGADNINQFVVREHPDLVILGFGMNDGGTALVSSLIFKRNMNAMITAIKNANPKTDIILISTMLANPASIVDQKQETYKPLLESFTGEGIVVADITSMHKELLKHKSYQDMTGNNINHPNDYLARWYAQFISNMLINNETSDINDCTEGTPDHYFLYQNYPNPFNSQTKIKYSIPKQSLVSLKVYNLLGQELVSLINSEHDRGSYSVNLDASSMSSGVYFYTLKCEDFISVNKLVLLK